MPRFGPGGLAWTIQGKLHETLEYRISSTEALPLEANVAATWWDELTQGARVSE